MSSPFAKGQNTDYLFNVNYNHFLINPYANMPSFYGDDYSNVNIQHQTYTGLLSDIKELYGDISFEGNNQYFGLKFFNSRQTSLFTRSKIFATYAVKVPINKNMSWVTGAQIGTANVFFGQSAVTNGGSNWGFDASLSSTLNINSWEIALAIQQIPNTILTPIIYTFELGRYTEMIIIKNFKLNEKWKLKSGLRTIISSPDPQFQIDNRLQYKNIASLLFSSEGLDPKSISVGFEYIAKLNEQQLRTSLSYQVSDSRTNFNSGQVMIGIGYQL